MSSSNQDSLLSANIDKRGFSVPKNLIWIVGGIVIASVVIVMFVQISMAGNQAPKQQQLKSQADTATVPSVETIERIAGEQTDAGKRQNAEEAKRLQEVERAKLQAENDKGKNSPLPGGGGGESFPAVDKSGNIALPVPLGTPQQSGSDPRIEAAARENLIRAAPIMAINDSSDTLQNLNGGNSKISGMAKISDLQTEQAEGRAQAQEKINSLLGMGAGSPGQTTASKGKLENDWLKETRPWRRVTSLLADMRQPRASS
ncbi:hypothetical protein ACFQAT_25895 [Undibacterium arcticum]|uniref:hypothetical protein n=1 Tax=Undibacterium arcticum TaxID=1762892 RepID=UPI003622FB3B